MNPSNAAIKILLIAARSKMYLCAMIKSVEAVNQTKTKTEKGEKKKETSERR